MNKLPLKKKQIIELFKKQKKIIIKSEFVNLQNSRGRFLFEDLNFADMTDTQMERRVLQNVIEYSRIHVEPIP